MSYDVSANARSTGCRGLGFLVLLMVSAIIGGSASAEPAFDNMVIFGDSLSDTGNAGRFSNGPVWVEHLATKLGVALRPSQAGGYNFAVGGARLDPQSGPSNLRAQADLFLRKPPPSGHVLYIVSGGGNDILGAIGRPDARVRVDTAAASLRSIVADLVARGAKDILVPNLPDVGMTPGVRAFGDAAIRLARVMSDDFNDAADRALAETIRSAPRDLRLYRVDVHALAERVRSDPVKSGFQDVTTPCNSLPNCAGYLFWDYVHPTTVAHARMAEAAFQSLSAPEYAPQ
jgi:phospholipase/lecithinase/hemolysin